MIMAMTVVRINAITVPADSGDELARRFAARAGAVDNQDGFEGFELLKPTDGRATWLVVTRWRHEEAFQAWMHSPAYGHVIEVELGDPVVGIAANGPRVAAERVTPHSGELLHQGDMDLPVVALEIIRILRRPPQDQEPGHGGHLPSPPVGWRAWSA
jgi:heme-degrading monooxygenase HmoA